MYIKTRGLLYLYNQDDFNTYLVFFLPAPSPKQEYFIAVLSFCRVVIHIFCNSRDLLEY